tara:strand:+ start:263 stop:430 length:168 start_codon:yes stop_codon:yes gene_type:complete
MFDWFKKLKEESKIEDECQELSSRAKPPFTEAFQTWLTKAPPVSKEFEDRKKFPS